MRDRVYPGKEILLSGESDHGRFLRTFQILKRISEGASVVCYEACYEKSGRGVLKEFYPETGISFQRDENGQLVLTDPTEGNREKFSAAAADYLEPYEMLLKIRQEDEENNLTAFLPFFEVYRGCDRDGNPAGSYYVWTPEPKLETFDSICAEIHKHPENEPEQKLVLVLHAIQSLTKCVCALHCADLIHRDIKPSNFGFVKRGQETLTQSLSLFDIDTICSVYARFDGAVGSPGYMEPEAGYEVFSNQTDIYAIGATLFYALVLTGESSANGYKYQDAWYSKLQEMVDQSTLINASEANSHPRLRFILAHILKKCLSPRAGRYSNCEELLDDLEEALYYALPSQIARKARAGERWVLTDVEHALAGKKRIHSDQVIPYFLYEHPLYQYAKPEEPTLNILLLGCGSYGQKFLDACLHAGQIYGKHLHVVVVTEDVSDRDIYLAERPELSAFFHIDEDGQNDPDSYGSVTFEITRIPVEERKSCIDLLRKVIRANFQQPHVHYVFTALGEDRMNLDVTKACARAVQQKEAQSFLCYVAEDPKPAEMSGKESRLYPLLVHADVTASACYEDVERMAFNTHLIWEKNLQVDFQAVRKDFRRLYNHSSCVASVLALKYKLFSIGIDLDQVSFAEAASLFFAKMHGSDPESKVTRDALIWIEHRRWVTEKICAGWSRIRDYRECLGGMTKDEKRKRHICILKSRPDQMLKDEFHKGNDYSKWDTASEAELAALDELDQMSVRLYRLFRERALQLKQHNLINGSSVTSIQRIVENDAEALTAFRQWHACMQDIWNGERTKVRLYKSYKDQFLRSAAGLPDNRLKALTEQVRALDVLFYPVLASMQMRDWKQDDTAMIDNIPFVLTYTGDLTLVIPFAGGSREQVFQNAAVSMMVNPGRIFYLALIRNEKELAQFQKDLQIVSSLLARKKLRAKTELLLLLACEDEILRYGFADETRRLSERGEIRRIQIVHVEKETDAAREISSVLQKKNRGKSILFLEKNDTELSNILDKSGVSNRVETYRFDACNMTFTELNRCDLLSYITKKPLLTVNDAVSFGTGDLPALSSPSYFSEYRVLWDLFQAYAPLWGVLCDSLRRYAKEHDLITQFTRSGAVKGKQPSKIFRYILPFICRDNAAALIAELKNRKIAGEQSRVQSYSADCCEVIIEDRYELRPLYDQVFSDLYALMIPESICVQNLKVEPACRDGIARLLTELQELGFIIHLQNLKTGFCFTLATGMIKRLLTDKDAVLRMYFYHLVKEQGYFDDINLAEDGLLVMTKGFRTILAVCSLDPNKDSETMHMLRNRRKQIGVHVAALLVIWQKPGPIEEADSEGIKTLVLSETIQQGQTLPFDQILSF